MKKLIALLILAAIVTCLGTCTGNSEPIELEDTVTETVMNT